MRDSVVSLLNILNVQFFDLSVELKWCAVVVVPWGVWILISPYIGSASWRCIQHEARLYPYRR